MRCGSSTYCLEDCITDLWGRLPNIDEYSNWRNRVIRSHFEYDAIISAYWIARLQSNSELVNDMFRRLPELCYEAVRSVEENIFINSFVRKKCLAVKYFWELLDDDRRMKTIAYICEKITSDDPRAKQYRDLFFARDGLDADLIMFFLRQVSFYRLDDVRIKILGSGFVLEQMLNWPYDNLFWKTLRESWNHHDSLDYNRVVSRIFKNVCYHQQFLRRDVKYHKIFDEIWEINPRNLKSSIDYHDALNLLYGMKETVILNQILNDEELSDRRTELLRRIAEIHVCGEEDLDFLQEFMTKVLKFEEERERFRSLITLAKR